MLRSSWKLLLILVLAVVLRTWGLADFPPSLNWDEASLGYNAYSLLKTGRDEWGQVLPTIFRAFGDYKLPVYVYMAVPLQALFGQTEIAIRLVSVLAGALTVLVVGRIAGKWAALVTAVIPWSVFLSRVSLEANLAVLMLSLGLALLIRQKYLLSVLFFGISVWTYNSCRLFVPLFLLSYWVAYRSKVRISLWTGVTGLVLFLPMFWQLLNPVGQVRYQTLTLLDEGAILQINNLRSRPGGRFVYNKATYWGYRFVTNYISYFSPQFLFLKGGSHYQFSIPGNGLVYLTLLPFALAGLVKLLINPKRFNWVWLWLLLYPIAGSVTRDSPHTLRAVVLLPVLSIVISLGIEWVIGRRKWITWGLLTLLVVELINYSYKAREYQINYSWAWQYGNSSMVRYVKDHHQQYDQILITKRYGEPHIFLAYHTSWNPAEYQGSAKSWDYHANWYWINRLGKVIFVNDWELKDMARSLSDDRKYLIVYSPESNGPGEEVLKINFANQLPAYILKQQP